MPEPVIVATARSPIGRAFKGSLKELRSDDLAATIVQAALDKVPQLDPHDIDDLMLGCGLPGGEQGYNMGRVVAVLLGYDFIPGTTITRYCSSSLQTTRMAAHAIRAGEGDAFISAGVEMVSRFVKGNSDTSPDTMNPRLEAARARTAELALGGSAWSDPRADAALPDIYISMGQTAENVAQLHGLTREEQDEFACRSQNNAERSIADGFFAREITPVTTPDGTLVSQDDTPRAGTTMEALAGLKPVFRPDGTVTAVETTRASGVMPSSAALVSLITITAAAPSLSGQALTAVTVPSGRNTGLRPARASIVVPARGVSSWLTSVPSGVVTGVISRAKKPSAMERSALFWLRQANSSCSSRVRPCSWATFSAVCPIEM